MYFYVLENAENGTRFSNQEKVREFLDNLEENELQKYILIVATCEKLLK